MKKTHLLLASLACATFGLSSVSFADTLEMPDTYYYVGGNVGQYYSDFNSHANNAGLTDTTLPGAQIGWRYNPNVSIQASWQRNEYSWENTANDGYMNVLLISSRFHFNGTSWAGFEPYLGLASGDMRMTPKGGDDQHQFLIGPELGAQTMLLPYLSLDVGARPLFRMQKPFSGDRRTMGWDGEIYAGLNFIFGAKGSQRQEPVQEAAAAPVAAPVVIGDADADGVPDSMDQCAGTAAGTQVDAKGCALDSDADGVADSQDKCAATPAGALVDEQGCQKVLTKDIRQTLYVQFGTGKAVVRQTSYPSIQRIADLAKQYPSAQLQLDGYTDSSGSAAINQRLSKERAEAVKTVLQNNFGVDAARITAEGRGEASPIADNTTREGRAQNRRVEVTLKAQTTQAQFKK